MAKMTKYFMPSARVGIAEGLGEQRHYHGYLDAGAVDTELHKPLFARHQLGEENLVRHLVQDAHEAEQQQRPRVLQHPACKRAVEADPESAEFRNEAERHQRGTGKVGKEDEAHSPVILHIGGLQPRMRAEHGRQHQEDDQVEKYVGDDEGELQKHELQRPAVEPELGEHDGLEGVQADYYGHAAHVLRVLGITHRAGNRAQECKHCGQEHQDHQPDHLQRRAVNAACIFALLGGEAEHGGLHAEGQQGQQQGGVGVEIGHYAVTSARRGDLVGVQRHQQIVQESPDYTAQPVNGRILCQRLQIHSVTIE